MAPHRPMALTLGPLSLLDAIIGGAVLPLLLVTPDHNGAAQAFIG